VAAASVEPDLEPGDVPLLKRLADEFASSDNFHQSVMGGTAANHIMLDIGDAVFFSDGNGNAITPPATVPIANPNPGDEMGGFAKVSRQRGGST